MHASTQYRTYKDNGGKKVFFIQYNMHIPIIRFYQQHEVAYLFLLQEFQFHEITGTLKKNMEAHGGIHLFYYGSCFWFIICYDCLWLWVNGEMIILTCKEHRIEFRAESRAEPCFARSCKDSIHFIRLNKSPLQVYRMCRSEANIIIIKRLHSPLYKSL